jgi:radical SAM superfamily enzyme YgiQ (UPF0313 family)
MANVIIFSDNTYFTPFRKFPRISLKSAGPYRIATEVRNRGLTCQIIEMMTEFSITEIESICKKFVSSETLIVGFSTTFWTGTHELLNNKIMQIISCSRLLNLNVKIIFGGANALDLVNRFKFDVDAIFLGYSESTFINYLDSLTKKAVSFIPDRMLGKIKIYEFVERSDVFNFCNSQIIYNDSDNLLPGEPVTLEVGRGCIFKCKFCSFPLTGKKKLDHLKDPEVIKEELIRNYEQYQIDKYVISDDTFNDSNEKLEYLHKIFTSLPFKIKFGAYIRLDLLNAHRHQIDLLKEMGLIGANIGVETFHEKAARTIGKGIVSNVAKQLLYDLKSEYWGDNVKIQINLITGLPYETAESYDETEKWILDDDACLVDTISIASLGLRNPKIIKNTWMSEFELNAEKYGYYWKDNNPFAWYNDNFFIKNSNEAFKMKTRLDLAIAQSKRKLQGGFTLFSVFAKTTFFEDVKSLDEQVNMNRKEYNNWFLKGTNKATEHFINDYKLKILK